MTFKKIDKESSNSITSALDFFNVPDTNVSISSSSFREYLTLNPLSDKPYTFKIFPSQSYLDLNKVYLLTEIKIRKVGANGALVDLDNTDNVSTINLIGSTWIKNVKVSIQNREIFDSNSLYAFKAYLENEIVFSEDCKNSFLQASGYYVDGEEQDSNTGIGYLNRKALFKDNKPVQFLSRIHADLFSSDLYLINNLELSIQITPNDDKFIILTQQDDREFKIEITGLKLYIKSLELTDGIALSVQNKLEKQTAKYAVRKSQIKSIFISENRTEYNGTLFVDQLPKRVILALAENSAFTGNSKKSPFNFKPFNIRSISLSANGKVWPASPYELDFTGHKYTRAFHDFNEAIGQLYTTSSNGITLKKYKEGWTFFVFNLNNSMEDEECFDLISEGTTSIEIKFNEPVQANGIVLVALGSFDSLIILDKYRNITSDTSV